MADADDRQGTVSPPAPEPSMLDAALSYAKRGWLVIPLHTIRADGTCTCKREDCGNPGKHPAVPGGLGAASTSEEQIQYWWGKWWKDANVGIVTGAESGLYVIDVDAKRNFGGSDWQQLVAKHKPADDDQHPWTTTATGITGGGGLHLYFRHPGDVRLPNTSDKLALGVATFGDGGYVVAAPSRHASTKRYSLTIDQEFAPVLPMPEWMVDVMLDRAPAPPRPPPPRLAKAESAVPMPALVDERPSPPTDNDLAIVVQLQTREEMTVQAQIDAARAQTIPKEKRLRPLVNRSPLALYQILRDPSGRKLIFGSDKAIRLNELTSDIYVGDTPLSATGPQKIRIEIEREFTGDDKNGGLRFGLTDVEITLRLVAEEHAYNPVREYLQGLKWDGVERIPFVLDEILNAPRTDINITMLRRWLISAVARAYRPGCKADLMLILVGENQGEKKGTFFEVLAGMDWYTCTPINIHDKDAASMMHSAWIMEWAELRSMMKAGDIESVKSFLTTAVDKYRPPYGRVPQPFPRTCVVCGTTNRAEFLADDTGNRRFLPITVTGKINIEKLRLQRDQLWAEAVALLNAGVPWWLSDEEEKQLPYAQSSYEIEDSWEAPIHEWIESKLRSEHTTADIIRGALDKPIGQWNRVDEMRVAKVMKVLGWRKNDKVRPRTWCKGETQPQQEPANESVPEL